jgi:hypothetical protein
MKKWLIPIIYFIFGLVIYYIESDVIVLIDEHVGIDGTFLNLLNIFLFTVIPVTLLIVIFIKRDLFKLSNKTLTLFILYNTLTLVIISVFWMNFLVWK